MVDTWVVVTASVAYLALLFAIAHYGDRRAASGRSIISNGYIYALSIAVYATSWTYYGSVGSAATGGIAWLPIYLGPMVVVALWWVVLRKIIRICKRDRITSLADFVSARYGKSRMLGGLVTVVAVVGLVPYIALQLKAISTTFAIVRGPDATASSTAGVPVLEDTALYAAVALAAFTIVFGTRHLDATERHEGMVAAIAFESLVKLVAFLAVGAWVTWGLFDGFPDIVAQASEQPELEELLTLGSTTGYGSFFWLMTLSMLAFLLLPRQWQVTVVENVDENHLRTAAWLFPVYLVLINLFVLPIALGGLLVFGEGNVDADTFVLALPMAEDLPVLALVVFLGGLSAATGMVIVETIALATMVSNSLVMPLLLRRRGPLRGPHDLGRLVLLVRRITIVALLLLGFIYFRVATDAMGLVQIGLISFAAVAQFAPAVLLGLYWKAATRNGAMAGLLAGVATWAYTLLLPSFSDSGWLPSSIPEEGPFGIELLAPHALLGLDGMDPVGHAMFWSMLANIGFLVAVSLTGRPGPVEQVQAAVFVDALHRPPVPGSDTALRRGSATVGALTGLLERFVGPTGVRRALASYDAAGADTAPSSPADAALIHHVETLLAGAVGSASARALVSSVTSEEPLGIHEVMEILDEASQVRAYSRALEGQSRELKRTTAELRAANDQLRELDRLKDDFVSTVTHELRTPLTSIRAFSEILLDNPDLDVEERRGFLQPLVEETERLTRLINQVLDLARLEAGAAEWEVRPVDIATVVAASTTSTEQLRRERGVTLEVDVPEDLPLVSADLDRVVQVMVNLLGNAVKFADPAQGRVRVTAARHGDEVRIDVQDNGSGVPDEDLAVIFDKFRQGGDTHRDRPAGTGLGLPISREIIDHLGGRLWAEQHTGHGATFSFTLPVAETENP
ncbi:sensor histidine kinase [Nocardioides sp.]|uniref:sensor histidine kinase n=1 Tax=Nocardioides sp. TaxID=35761 RepID=UPI002734BEE4|nr:sensor histidine kinase [Nocardioides sp.]MDP3892497.1 sensor histidine kinase [Nocardioides sp.]